MLPAAKVPIANPTTQWGAAAAPRPTTAAPTAPTYTTRIGTATVAAPRPTSPVPANQPTNQLFQSVSGQTYRYNPSTSTWFQIGTVTTAPRPTAAAALPQPAAMTPPRVTPAPPPAPTSPVSGQAIQANIFQPTHTSSTILQQAPSAAGSTYVAPEHPLAQAAPAPVSQPVSAPELSGSATVVAPNGGGGVFGLDQNTLLTLLVLAAVILVLVVD